MRRSIIVTHCLQTESPVVVVLSGSMEPAFQRGDILFLNNQDNPIRVGEIVVFKIKDRGDSCFKLNPHWKKVKVGERIHDPILLILDSLDIIFFLSLCHSNSHLSFAYTYAHVLSTFSPSLSNPSHLLVRTDIPIVHRVTKVHEKENGEVEVLTKGDNNRVDDRGLYAPGSILWIIIIPPIFFALLHFF